MVKEAEAHAEEDRKRKSVVEARNHLDSLIYNTEKTIRENREKLPADLVAKAESAVGEAKEALKSDDEPVLKAAADKLMREAHALAEKMYQQAASAPPPSEGGEAAAGAAAGAKGAEGDVVEAEYEDPGKK
jgi:molecular chaperone DnaK